MKNMTIRELSEKIVEEISDLDNDYDKIEICEELVKKHLEETKQKEKETVNKN